MFINFYSLKQCWEPIRIQIWEQLIWYYFTSNGILLAYKLFRFSIHIIWSERCSMQKQQNLCKHSSLLSWKFCHFTFFHSLSLQKFLLPPLFGGWRFLYHINLWYWGRSLITPCVYSVVRVLWLQNFSMSIKGEEPVLIFIGLSVATIMQIKKPYATSARM